MTVVQQQGMIAEATAKQEVAKKAKTPSAIMKDVVNNKSMQDIIKNSLGENAGAFTASVIDLYNSDTYLQKCDPRQVAAEVLKAVSLKLPINKQLGYAYIVPYNNTPQFQLGYKGMIQLAQRTGAYKHMNAGPVYEGELRTIDKLTGDIDLNGEKVENAQIIGYFAYIETVTGFSKCIYWTKAEVEAHGKKHSKSYNNSNSAWKTNFDEMAQKTLLRNLLSKWGVMSVEMADAMSKDGDFAGNVEDAENSIVGDETIDAEYEVE